VSGTWIANADGTYSDNTTTSGNLRFELPPECGFTGGTVVSCSRLDGPLMALGLASVTCTGSETSGCSCAATVDQTGGIGLVSTAASASGNYSTSTTVLTATPGDLQYSYCVSGATLALTPQSVGTTGTLTGTVELEQQ
jgi:hypothetical protein